MYTNRLLVTASFAILAMLSGCALPSEGTAVSSEGLSDGVPTIPCQSETDCASALGAGYSCNFTAHTCGVTCDKQTDCALALGPGFSCDTAQTVCVSE